MLLRCSTVQPHRGHEERAEAQALWMNQFEIAKLRVVRVVSGHGGEV